MGSDVQGNKVSIPLAYSEEYLCGTKILDGIYEDEFAISIDNGQTPHKQAIAYAYPPVAIPLEKSDGKLTELEFASLSADSSVVMTTVYPENGYLLARFCNYSDEKQNLTFSTAYGKITEETDLLGNRIADSDGELEFRPWEIKTVKIEL